MKKLLLGGIAVCAVSVGWGSSALAAEATVKATAVDFRACNFQSGKTMKDLDKVSAKFKQYANKNDFAYSAWTLTPQYHNGAEFDVGWLGAWPSGDAYGLSMEKWVTTGQALQAEFDQVIDCGNHHELALSLPINAPEGTPTDGLLMIYKCTLEDGKTLGDAYAAHLEWGTAKKGMGFLDNSWMFQPAIGAGDIDFDYYHAVVFYRYSDLGAGMELYANGGGMQRHDKILGGVSSCQTPSIYDALSVRAYEGR
ncbi:MAG: hypothetical protein DRR04_07365 [Gammaproteobacteria bacterium]|nr:MAG: hypothetical protein DRR04_07365 [Gammaproteobacteria bacterium]